MRWQDAKPGMKVKVTWAPGRVEYGKVLCTAPRRGLNGADLIVCDLFQDTEMRGIVYQLGVDAIRCEPA